MAYHSVFYPDSPAKPMKRTGGEITRIPKRPSEDITLGYLGYEAKGEHVRLVTSPIFIPAYLYYRKAQENAYFSNKISAIAEAISWLHIKLDADGIRDPTKCVVHDRNGVRGYSKSAIPNTLCRLLRSRRGTLILPTRASRCLKSIGAQMAFYGECRLAYARNTWNYSTKSNVSAGIAFGIARSNWTITGGPKHLYYPRTRIW
jgi:hypothetical protein